MAKFNVEVTERVTVSYHVVVIEAPDEDAANDIAEEMRVEGKLRVLDETVDDVWIEPVPA